MVRFAAALVMVAGLQKWWRIPAARKLKGIIGQFQRSDPGEPEHAIASDAAELHLVAALIGPGGFNGAILARPFEGGGPRLSGLVDFDAIELVLEPVVAAPG